MATALKSRMETFWYRSLPGLFGKVAVRRASSSFGRCRCPDQLRTVRRSEASMVSAPVCRRLSHAAWHDLRHGVLALVAAQLPAGCSIFFHRGAGRSSVAVSVPLAQRVVVRQRVDGQRRQVGSRRLHEGRLPTPRWSESSRRGGTDRVRPPGRQRCGQAASRTSGGCSLNTAAYAKGSHGGLAPPQWLHDSPQLTIL